MSVHTHISGNLEFDVGGFYTPSITETAAPDVFSIHVGLQAHRTVRVKEEYNFVSTNTLLGCRDQITVRTINNKVEVY